MRLTMSLDVLLLLLASGTTSAWTPSSSSSLRSSSRLLVGQGWDNDDFLNSLGGSSSERERVTEDYYAQSRFGKDLEKMPPPLVDEIPIDGGTKGAVITEEMKQRIKEQNEKDESQGGTMFRELMAKAQQRQARPDVGPNNMPSYMTVQPYEPPPVASPAAPVTPDALAGLTVEQQAELFRQMIAGNAAANTLPSRNTPGAFPQAYPPQGAAVAPDGRRVGRNRDADQIQNSADLYFAQLKRDSAIRKQAWLVGDQEKANAVFADPSIKEIEERITPFLEERKRNEQGVVVGTSEDEMITPELLAPLKPAPVPSDYTGISYKEKMRQMREKKLGGGASSSSSTVESVAPAPSPAPVAPAPVAAAAPVAPAPAASTPSPVAPPAPEVTRAAPQESTSSAPLAPPSEEDKRSDIRTLMGLLLKHRGGPGFGAGRLKGDEVTLFQNLSKVLVEVLSEEGVSVPEAVVATQSAPLTMGQGAGGATTEKVNSLISVLEGAITMYKNSPAELKESVLGILRAALTTAVSSLDEIVGSPSSSGPSTGENPGASSEERVQSMIACIEAACQVYKNSPPELQQPVLMTLRAAFVSAANTLNGVMAGTATTPAVVAESQPVAPTAPTYSGNDENTQFLDGVYSKLSDAAGDDKLGLRKDLTAAQAADLADSIAEMRTRLVDELENGLPE